MQGFSRLLLLGSLAATGLSSAARAASLGVGILTAPKAALSVQVTSDSAPCAYHVAAHLATNEAMADLDCQLMMPLPSWSGRLQKTALYAGFGLRGAANRWQGRDESYHLRLPLGLQVDMPRVHLSGFAETTALLGPLPTTAVSFGAALGMRTFF